MKIRIRTKSEVLAAAFVLVFAACSGSDSGGVYQGGGGRSGAGGSGNPNCAMKTACFERCMCEGGSKANATLCVSQCNSGGNLCGNNVVDPGEQCDNADLRGATCASWTVNARPTGMLRCANCMIDANGCTGGAGPGGAGGGSGMGGGGGIGGGVGGMGP
jgi:hypothetical protein